MDRWAYFFAKYGALRHTTRVESQPSLSPTVINRGRCDCGDGRETDRTNATMFDVAAEFPCWWRAGTDAPLGGALVGHHSIFARDLFV